MLGAVLLATLVLPAQLAAADVQNDTYRIFSFGDSYSSGTGIGGREYGPSNCHQNTSAYPFEAKRLVATALGTKGPNVENAHYACHGLYLDAIEDQVRGAVGDGLGSADLITITGGGNDLGFSKIVAECVVADNHVPCDRALTFAEDNLQATVDRLSTIVNYARVNAPYATVAVVGYPFLTKERCGFIRDGMAGSQAKQERLYQFQVSANTVTKKMTTRHARVSFFDSGKLFSGHGPCSDDPWVNKFALSEGSFHPNREGHERWGLALAKVALAPRGMLSYALELKPNRIALSGWAVDPDVGASTWSWNAAARSKVRLKLFKRVGNQWQHQKTKGTLASRESNTAAVNGWAYRANFKNLAAGRYQVCATARNTNLGSHTKLGCLTTDVDGRGFSIETQLYQQHESLSADDLDGPTSGDPLAGVDESTISDASDITATNPATTNNTAPATNTTTQPASGVRLVKHPNATDAHMLYPADGLRRWVDANCLNQIQAAGKPVGTFQNWTTEVAIYTASNTKTCAEYQADLGTTNTNVTSPGPSGSVVGEFVAITGYDQEAWILRSDGTRQWLDAACRSQLTNTLGQPRSANWSAELASRPDTPGASRLSCSELQSQL